MQESIRGIASLRLNYHEWEALIHKIAEGDHSALTSLYDATGPLLFGLVIRVVRDRFAAEEVLLDVYTQVWRRANTYDTARGAPLAWLMMIARSRAIDRLRAGKRELERWEPLDRIENEPSITPNPEEESTKSERQQLVQDALESIAPEQSEAIRLAYFSGLSHSEIAARLGEPLGTVKTRVRLGMIKLSDLLREVFE